MRWINVARAYLKGNPVLSIQSQFYGASVSIWLMETQNTYVFGFLESFLIRFRNIVREAKLPRGR